jgi:hypothetical protein
VKGIRRACQRQQRWREDLAISFSYSLEQGKAITIIPWIPFHVRVPQNEKNSEIQTANAANTIRIRYSV